jgi:glycosyltransferase involved in cell wall biosynthesis
MRPYVHFHSDCQYFAGCENMLANFFCDERLAAAYDLSFSYRYSQEYEQGFRERVRSHLDIRPLRLKDEGQLIRNVRHRLPWAAGFLQVAARVLLLRYWFVLLNTITIYRMLGRRTPDIVHINNGNYPGAYSCMSAVFAARLRGVRRIVYVVNNVAIPYSTLRRRLDYPLDRLVAGMVLQFVTASRFAGAELRKVLRLPEAKVANLHNGIAPRPATETRAETLGRLGIGGTRLLVGVVAILEERKGHIYLLDALRRIKGRGGRMPLIIIEGEGPQRGFLENFVRVHRLGDDVRMIGRESRIFNLMNAMDVIVLPSVSHEDFPNVVLEAMCLGKPVIGTRISGIPEQIVHMETGLIVEPADAEGLAQALQQLDAEPDLRARLGSNAQLRFAHEFTAEAAVGHYLGLYRQLLSH